MANRTLAQVAGLLSVWLLAPGAQADATVTMKDISGGADSTIAVKGHLVRISQAGQADYLVFDASREVAIHVNTADKKYMEIDRAKLAELADSVGAMKQQMAPQMAMMRERLKSLPPEQRAMIEQQMGGMVNLGAMESKPAEEITTVKRGTDKIAGFACQRYDVLSNKQRIADACVATATGAGMSKADFETLSATMKFLRDMAENAQKMASGMGAPQLSIGDVEGVPVAMKDFKNGHEFQVSAVSDKSVDAAQFSEYEGFSKQSLPMMR